MRDRPASANTSDHGDAGDSCFLDSLWLQREAASIGFDWPDIDGVVAKLQEEIDEIRGAIAVGESAQAKAELGDLLFSVVNLARFVDADPGMELHRANERFRGRLGALIAELEREGIDPATATLAEMDAVWERVKRGIAGIERGGGSEPQP